MDDARGGVEGGLSFEGLTRPGQAREGGDGERGRAKLGARADRIESLAARVAAFFFECFEDGGVAREADFGAELRGLKRDGACLRFRSSNERRGGDEEEARDK